MLKRRRWIKGSIAFLNDTVLLYNQGMNMVFCDANTKYRSVGARGIGVKVANYNDPGYVCGAIGSPDGFLAKIQRRQTTPTAPLYASFYRPDSEFNHQFGNTPGTMCRQ